MNLYFLLEGEKTELMVYPNWISQLLPHFSKVDFELEATTNNYYIFSCNGIPSIYNHTVNAIKNINDNLLYDYLIVCLDSEDIGSENRLIEINDYIFSKEIMLNSSCKLVYIIQNVCIESWFLGNRKIVKRNPMGDMLKKCILHYDIINNDPELMDKTEPFKTKAQFHHFYFREIAKEHNLSYGKSNPKIVLQTSFLNELVKRIEDTNHLLSFKLFVDLMADISEKTSPPLDA